MATKLKPIAHEDRLSIVEHLDELRTRIIICVLSFVVVAGICLWQDDRILHIVNQPLVEAQSGKPCDETRDPLEQADCWQQAQKRLNEKIATTAQQLAATAGARSGAARAGRVAPGRRDGRRRRDAARVAAAPGHAGRRRAADRDAHRGRLRGAADHAAAAALPALRVRPAGVLAARARGRGAADGVHPVPVLLGRRLRVLRRAAGGGQLPAELQRRQLRRAPASTRLLQVLDHGPGGHGGAVPDADRDPRDHADGDPHPEHSCARTAATRSW